MVKQNFRGIGGGRGGQGRGLGPRRGRGGAVWPLNGAPAEVLGIAAVSARVENGTLKILKDACPNLLHEAGLYR